MISELVISDKCLVFSDKYSALGILFRVQYSVFHVMGHEVRCNEKNHSFYETPDN
jgi:hypothetical protein